MSAPALSVVIPAFNEEASVAAVVSALQNALRPHAEKIEIIVVDDGSMDRTAQAARESGAVVLRHPINRGYGQAIRTGIQGAKHGWILTIDADGSYPPAESAKLLKYFPDFDLVIGQRQGSHFWGSPFKALLRRFYLAIASFVVGEKLPDGNSGLRLFRKDLALDPGPVQCLGFSYSTTMTLSFIKAGRFVKFTPIEFQERIGKSKVRLARDMLRTLQIMTQVLIAYNPLKLFVVLAAAPALGFAAFLVRFALRGGSTSLIAALLCALGALWCFTTGCLLDAWRMKG